VRGLQVEVEKQAGEAAASDVLANRVRDMLSVTVLSDILEKSVRLICEMVQADRATLLLLTDDKAELWSKITVGRLEVHEIRVKADAGIAGYCVQSGNMLNLQVGGRAPLAGLGGWAG
jgi:signal transduction protein with GAF and PtsI domain